MRVLADMGIILTGAGKGDRGIDLEAAKSLEQRGSALSERRLDAKHGFVILGCLGTVFVMKCMTLCVRSLRNKYV